jgi:hypothetical protein
LAVPIRAIEAAQVGPFAGPGAGHEKVMSLALGCGGCMPAQPASIITPAAATHVLRIVLCITTSCWFWCDP